MTFVLTPEEQAREAAMRTRNLRWLRWLGGIALFMGVASFVVFPPLYRLWCEYAGVALSPNSAFVGEVATGRFVTVFCDAVVADDLPVEFLPDRRELRAEVGMDVPTVYRIRNFSDRLLEIHPVHSVIPRSAAKPFAMKVCFCFNDFALEPGESKEFPIVFNLTPDLPGDVGNVRLSYHLFRKAEGEAARRAQQERIRRETPGVVISPQDALR